ncbi:hypothetical protein BDV93DRAFT_611045 [Ceratobasidium sp. AG-I]|nr:hypothetical protein BDV93DRAFT_611045 [Ceratobasidium sp. AG-I]
MTAIHELEIGLFHAHVSRCTSFAGFALLVYDHLLTFSDEVRFIWKRPGNPISIMFLINRYATPLILAVDIYDKGGLTKNLDNQFCKVWFVVEGYLNFLLFAVIHGIMVMRVSALYGNRKEVSIPLYTAYALYFLSTFSIVTPGMLQAVSKLDSRVAFCCIPHIASRPAESFYSENMLLHACWGKLVDYFWVTWIPALLLETLVFCLTAWKAWQHSQANMNVPVAKTLYRDGFQYFFVIVLCTLFPLLVWTKAPNTLDAMPKYASMAIVNVMAFRLVLNLRRHSANGTDLTTFDTYEMSNDPSTRSARSAEVRHAQTIGSGPNRRAAKTDLESALDTYLDIVDQYRSKEEEVKVERPEQSTDHFPPHHRSFELDLEVANAHRIGRSVRETDSVHSTCPSDISNLPPRARLGYI